MILPSELASSPLTWRLGLIVVLEVKGFCLALLIHRSPRLNQFTPKSGIQNVRLRHAQVTHEVEHGSLTLVAVKVALLFQMSLEAQALVPPFA